MVTVEKTVKKKIPGSSEVATQTTPAFTATSEILSILIFMSGCVVLLGWVLDIPTLKSIFPSLMTMKVNTALGFIFSGLSIWALQIKRRDNPRFQRMALACSSVVFGIGLLTVLEYVLGWDLGIDQLLCKELSGAVPTPHIDRMAFTTAINFTITGLALFFLAFKTKNQCLITQVLMIPVGIISLLAFVGYLYKAPFLFIELSFSRGMALHTAVLFLLTFWGLLFCRPGCGLMILASSEDFSGKLIRRLLPVTFLIPLILGWLKLHWVRMGVTSDEFGVSFVATGNLVLTSLCIYGLIFFIRKAEIERARAIKKLGIIGISELSYRRLFETAKDGILIVDFDAGTIVDVNPFLCDLLGYRKNEFLEKHLWEIGLFKDIAPSQNVFKKLQTQEYVRYENLPLESKSGKKCEVEFVSNVYRLGSQKVIQCNIRDITRRREIENGLEKARKELAATKISEDAAREYAESIINTVREPLIALDQDLRVVSASRSFYDVFMVNPTETVGQLIYDLGNKQWDIPKLRELLETILPQRAAFDNYEVEHDFTTIGRRIMLLNARQIQRVLGKDRIILLAIEDITERKGIEAGLEKAHEELKVLSDELKCTSKVKSEFLANMSHELRTPLTSIIGFSEVLYDEKLGVLNKPQKECTQNVLTSGQHLLSLINDVLDLSKVESGKMALEVSLFSIKDCLEEVLRVTAGVAFSKKINPVVEIAEDLGEINADLRKIKQIIFNLMSNAIKFTPVGGKVGLRARRDGSGIEVVVWDMGIGIPPKDLGKVFEAFERLGDAYTQETEGTGLGLTITQKLVELHGGKIWIESEGIGKGTTVKFMIPTKGS